MFQSSISHQFRNFLDGIQCCLSVMPININYIHSLSPPLLFSHFLNPFPSFARLAINHLSQFLVIVLSLNFVAIIFSIFPFLLSSLSFSPMPHVPPSYFFLFSLQLSPLCVFILDLVFNSFLFLETSVHYLLIFFSLSLFSRNWLPQNYHRKPS